jgi:hypothetical protein
LQEPPVPPRKLDSQIPRDLETIVLKCLAKDASGRYATAEELAEDLRLFLAYRTIRARRASRWEQTRRWCRRNPVVASLLAAVAVLLVAVAVVSAFYAAHQKAAAIELVGALKDTEKAERAARLREAEALIGQAHGTRNSRRPGQRIEALAALEKALALGRELDQPAEWFDRLRTEAIAALALPDVEVVREWEGWPAGTVGPEFDDNLERYALLATDGTMSVRRVSDDSEIARWQEGTVSQLRFSPDGRFLCVCHSPSGRLTVRRLDVPEPIICHQETKARNGEAMEFSPDSKRLAYFLRTDTRVAVVDLASKQVRYLPPTGAENQEHIRFAPDGRRFALLIRRSGKWAVEVYDATTGQVQRSFPQPTTVSHLAWNPDGRTLAICCNDQVIRLWDLASGRLLWSQPHPTTVSHLVWHPDGRTVATCCDDLHIRLWDLASGRLLRVLEGHNDVGIQCAFTHTGDWLVSNDWDNTLRIWELSSGRQLLRYSAGGGLRVSSEDRVVAARIRDSTSTQLLRLHAGREYRTISAVVSRRRNIHYEFPKVHSTLQRPVAGRHGHRRLGGTNRSRRRPRSRRLRGLGGVGLATALGALRGSAHVRIVRLSPLADACRPGGARALPPRTVRTAPPNKGCAPVGQQPRWANYRHSETEQRRGCRASGHALPNRPFAAAGRSPLLRGQPGRPLGCHRQPLKLRRLRGQGLGRRDRQTGREVPGARDLLGRVQPGRPLAVDERRWLPALGSRLLDGGAKDRRRVVLLLPRKPAPGGGKIAQRNPPGPPRER